VIVGLAAHVFVNGKRLSGEIGYQAFELGFDILVGEQVSRQETLTNDF
jgi:hypothetical protein